MSNMRPLTKEEFVKMYTRDIDKRHKDKSKYKPDVAQEYISDRHTKVVRRCRNKKIRGYTK